MSAPLKLDLDVLAALVALALVAAVVAELTTGVPSSIRRPGGDDASAGMTAALASAEVELPLAAPRCEADPEQHQEI